MKRRLFVNSTAATLGGAALGLGFVTGVLADEAFPTKPIKIVVPTGAGGITDVLARIVAQQLSTRLKQAVYIDNRAGASGILGSDIVAKSAPDGYTLLMAFPTHPVNPSLFAKMPYNTQKDFSGISTVSSVSLVLLVNPASPLNSVRDVIAKAKAEPGALNFGSVGNGSLGHLGAELFASSANVKMTHIPYKSVPQMQTALLANEIDIYFDAPVTSVNLVKGGQLKALGVSTKARNASFPGVPTISEAGLPGFEVTSWNGLLAPAGTPPAVVARLNTELVAILNDPEIRAKFEGLGVDALASAPEAFDQLIRSDLNRWEQVLKKANIKLE